MSRAAKDGSAAKPADRMFAEWEKGAAQAAEAFARDPRTLAMGAGMLRAQMLWARSLSMACEAAWAPFEALTAPDGSR